MTINGEWTVWVLERDWEVLEETARRGFVAIGTNNINFNDMKASKLFIDTIADFLKKEAGKDKEFARKMEEHLEKTPEAVCNYIMAEVGKAKRCGWADDEIFGMAKHFIEEDELKDPGDVNSVSRVVVNRHVDLSEEDKSKAYEEAVKRHQDKLDRKAKEEERKTKERSKAKAEREREKLKEKMAKDGAMMQDLFGGV